MMTMNPYAAACTENRSDMADEIAQQLDARDGASYRLEGQQLALMIVLADLPGADEARAVAGRLNLLIDEADAAGVRAVVLLQAHVQQLRGRAA